MDQVTTGTLCRRLTAVLGYAHDNAEQAAVFEGIDELVSLDNVLEAINEELVIAAELCRRIGGRYEDGAEEDKE
jgi:hypothetical protein